jgi:hypothetical protein
LRVLAEISEGLGRPAQEQSDRRGHETEEAKDYLDRATKRFNWDQGNHLLLSSHRGLLFPADQPV